jgi:DNA-binding GntR family transcriptional regulator
MTLAANPPLSMQLFETLRHAIIVGNYPQGSLLHEARLAEDFNVSRIPIREALPRLHNEGFIQSAPRRSAVVSTWTAQRINDLFDVRLGLEVIAAGAAARRVRAGGSLDELEAAIAECEGTLKTLTPGDWYRLSELQVAVHIALVAAAYNELMDSLMQAVGGRMIWIFYLAHQVSGSDFAAQGQHEHEAILDALRSGNDRLAEALTSAHIEAGRAPMVAALAS